MLSAAEQERYLRHILLKEIGAQGQQALKAARVLVVGAGGVGAPVIQYLAAAGVGAITIADDDVVDRSNLQRQTIFRDADIGRPKADAAADFARALNPEIAVCAHAARIGDGDGQGDGALVAAHDLVIEGVDSFDARFALNRLTIAARRPLVSAMLGRFDGMVALFKPWAGDLPCLACYVGAPPPRDAVIACAEEGVAGPVAGLVGAYAALEALKEICRFGDSLAGRILILDALAPAMRVAKLPRDPECSECGGLRR